MTTQTRTIFRANLIHAVVGALAGTVIVVAVGTLLSADAATVSKSAAATLTAGHLSQLYNRTVIFAADEMHVMGLPLDRVSQTYWFVARAGGIGAYLLLWVATLLGLMTSSKMLKGHVDAALIVGMHEFFPILATVFAGLHAAVLLGDTYIGFGLADLIVPFRTSYLPLWTGMGITAFYLGVALIASFYLRSRIGRKTWRAFHYTALLAFGLALMHGLMTGSDTALPAIRWMYIATGATILFAIYYRVFSLQPKRAHASEKLAASTIALTPQE